MTLKNQIQTHLTAAMKARDEDTKRTLRLVMTSIKLAEVESGGDLDDSRILSILQKEVKTREDTIEEARSANRKDLVEAAEKELLILQNFLPKQMGKDDLKAFAEKIIQDLGATGIKDMGQVMKILIPQLEGRASGQEASQVVRDLLQAK
jgi:uncharacterized protein YqeY